MPAPPEFQDLRHPPLTLAHFRARCAVQHYNEGNFAWLSGDPCVYCQRTEAELNRERRLFHHNRRMTREHIIPQSEISAAKLRARGLPKDFGRGVRGWENLAPACPQCNSQRSNTPWLVWLVQQHERLGPSSWHPFRPGYRRPDPQSSRPLTQRLELALIGAQLDTDCETVRD